MIHYECTLANRFNNSCEIKSCSLPSNWLNAAMCIRPSTTSNFNIYYSSSTSSSSTLHQTHFSIEARSNTRIFIYLFYIQFYRNIFNISLFKCHCSSTRKDPVHLVGFKCLIFILEDFWDNSYLVFVMAIQVTVLSIKQTRDTTAPL